MPAKKTSTKSAPRRAPASKKRGPSKKSKAKAQDFDDFEAQFEALSVSKKGRGGKAGGARASSKKQPTHVINPETGRKIKVGGTVHKKLYGALGGSVVGGGVGGALGSVVGGPLGAGLGGALGAYAGSGIQDAGRRYVYGPMCYDRYTGQAYPCSQSSYSGY